MSDRYEDTISVIQDMAAVKRTMNRHKGKIENISKDGLLYLLSQEVEELKNAE